MEQHDVATCETCRAFARMKRVVEMATSWGDRQPGKVSGVAWDYQRLTEGMSQEAGKWLEEH